MTLDLVIIGLATTLEPIPITVMILLLSSTRGVRKGLVFVLAWMACLVVVIGGTVLITHGKPLQPASAPSTAALAVKMALGVTLILIGLRQRRRVGMPHKSPAWMDRLDSMSWWTVAGLGVFLQPWTLVAAGAATVLDAKLSSAGTYLLLVFFCLLGTSSLLSLEIYSAFWPTAAESRLENLKAWMEGHRDQVIVVGSLLVGLWLLSKSIYQLVS